MPTTKALSKTRTNVRTLYNVIGKTQKVGDKSFLIFFHCVKICLANPILNVQAIVGTVTFFTPP